MTKWKIELTREGFNTRIQELEGTARDAAAFAKGCQSILGNWGYTIAPIKPPIRVWICTVVLKHGDYTARSRISRMDAENKAILSANVGNVGTFDTMHHEMTIEDKS